MHPLTVGELLAMSGEGASLPDVHLGYPQTNGTLDLRRAIAGMYPGATPDHVEVTNGGSEANCVVLMRLVEPGDRIVFMSPNYMQATGLARGLGAELVPVAAPSRRRRRCARHGRSIWTSSPAS